jgi:hypothetical protein
MSSLLSLHLKSLPLGGKVANQIQHPTCQLSRLLPLKLTKCLPTTRNQVLVCQSTSGRCIFSALLPFQVSRAPSHLISNPSPLITFFFLQTPLRAPAQHLQSLLSNYLHLFPLVIFFVSHYLAGRTSI